MISLLLKTIRERKREKNRAKQKEEYFLNCPKLTPTRPPMVNATIPVIPPLPVPLSLPPDPIFPVLYLFKPRETSSNRPRVKGRGDRARKVEAAVDVVVVEVEVEGIGCKDERMDCHGRRGRGDMVRPILSTSGLAGGLPRQWVCCRCSMSEYRWVVMVYTRC